MNNIIDKFYSTIRHRHVLKGMVIKDLKDKYVDSKLGVIWAFINPILTILAITFVFTKVIRTDIRHYPLMVLSVFLPWVFFSSSISESTTSIKRNAGMLGQFTVIQM